MKRIGGYHCPSDVNEALELADTYGEAAAFLAGGQSLVNRMKQRAVDENLEIIDIGGLSELSFVRAEANTVRIGALTTHSELVESDVLGAHVPTFVDVASQVADTQVRNLGTIGGSLAEAEPASDYPGFITAIGATFETASTVARRTIPADEFFVGDRETALEPAELLTEVHLPIPDGDTRIGFDKFAGWNGSAPLVNATAVLSTKGQTCTSGHVVIGCVTATPTQSTRVAEYIAGTPIFDVEPAVAGAYASEEIDPAPNRRIGSAYQRDLVEASVSAAVQDCLGQ